MQYSFTLERIQDTYTNITTNKRNNMFAYDSTNDIAKYIDHAGSIKDLATYDLANGEPTFSFDEINLYSNGWFGLSASRARLEISFYTYIRNADLQGEGDIYRVPWTDYSSSSTITGWSSYSEKHIYYYQLGKFLCVKYYLKGTSNSSTTSFTVPCEENSYPMTSNQLCIVDDTTLGMRSWGKAFGTITSSVLTILITNIDGTSLDNSGTKQASGCYTIFNRDV